MAESPPQPSNPTAAQSSNRRGKRLLLPLSCLVALVLSLYLLPTALPYDPLAHDLDHRLEPPSRAHPMGTDNFGRDVLTRILYGGRADLQIAVFGVLLSFVPGVLIGVYAGFRGGWADTLLMRTADVFLAFPHLVLVIAIVAVLGAGVVNIYIAIALTGWIYYSRLVRSVTLVVTEMEYTQAAIVIGCRTWRIMWRHIGPNVLGSAIVFATSDVMLTILWVASLGFLGLGVRPPNPEWGAMVAAGRSFLGRAPWIAIFPGLALVITGVVFSLLSDGLTDYLRPRA